jgi:hypothetical protein
MHGAWHVTALLFWTTKKAAGSHGSNYFSHIAWQRPILPGVCTPSTIGAGGLNDRVRDGNEWNPSAMVTRRI